MKKLQIAYFGTPDFSARFLEKILTDKDLPVEVKFVVTQPDKPVGRKQILTPTPIKEVATRFGIEIYDHLSAAPLRSKILDLRSEIDISLLYAYGEILPNNLLSLPKLGFWNIHPSLLPKYRGPQPMVFPLILGDEETGVSLMQITEKMDQGPIIAQEKYEIKPADKRPDLENNLTAIAYDLFKKTVIDNFPRIQDLRSKILDLSQQNHSQATYTRLLKKDDGFVPFEILKSCVRTEHCSVPTDQFPKIITDYYQRNHLDLSKISDQRSKIIYNLFRGLYPWPGIWTKVNINGQEKRLKITDMSFRPSEARGEIPSKLIINRVQLEGKNEVDFKTFSEAYILF